jgi:glycosyltransferase involved in cell wall biosynthesis
MQISAVIITKNEAESLPGCLQNIRDLVEEIVVVDSGSSDRTIEKAKQFADLVMEHPFEDFSKQRNYAASLASNSWILTVDADELLSPELKERIQKLKQETNARYQAYCFPRKTFRKDGSLVFNIVSYPGFHYRLYHRDFCRWKNPVHEALEVNGRRKFYPEHLLHHPDYDRVPEKEELYNSLKRNRENKSALSILDAADNFLFHFRALFIDLEFYRKGWIYWKHGAQILIHLAGLRLKQRNS